MLRYVYSPEVSSNAQESHYFVKFVPDNGNIVITAAELSDLPVSLGANQETGG